MKLYKTVEGLLPGLLARMEESLYVNLIQKDKDNLKDVSVEMASRIFSTAISPPGSLLATPRKKEKRGAELVQTPPRT